LIEGDNETKEELEEEATGISLNDEVAAALKKLEDEFKLVIVLADIEGFTYKEIADILEIPIGTVRSRLSRARKKLQKQLESYARKRGYISGRGKETS
jgi:RNA polymerase sigma-70 factor (ECF subfamily)